MSTPSRRDFLKVKSLGIAGLFLSPRMYARPHDAILAAELLGRVVEPRVEVKNRPDAGSQILDSLAQDSVVSWYKEVVGVHPYRINRNLRLKP